METKKTSPVLPIRRYSALMWIFAVLTFVVQLKCSSAFLISSPTFPLRQQLSPTSLAVPSLSTLRNHRHDATQHHTDGLQQRQKALLALCLSLNPHSTPSAPIESSQAFRILGIHPPTTDNQVIRDAYQRMVNEYHPDVITNQNSTPEEKQKANAHFARVRSAYHALTNTEPPESIVPSATAINAKNNKWVPPHQRRQKGSESSSANSSSSSSSLANDALDPDSSKPNRDVFMPPKTFKSNDNDDNFDISGDSFQKILTDLFLQLAMGTSSSSSSPSSSSNGNTGQGILSSLLQLLEGDVNGTGRQVNDFATTTTALPDTTGDADLRALLRSGTIEEVGNEMADSEQVLNQLNSKLTMIQQEIETLNTKAKLASRYREKVELEESLAEATARQQVVSGFAKRVQKRLLAIQGRYKEMITTSRSRTSPLGRESKTTLSSRNPQYNPNISSWSTSSHPPSDSTPLSSSENLKAKADSEGHTTQDAKQTEDESWRKQSFGSSFRRGRRGSRGRPSRPTLTSSDPSHFSGSPVQPSTPPTPPTSKQHLVGGTKPLRSSSPQKSEPRSTSPQPPRRPQTVPNSPPSSVVPPHRRPPGYYRMQKEEAEKARQQIIDEELEKLKRDMGL